MRLGQTNGERALRPGQAMGTSAAARGTSAAARGTSAAARGTSATARGLAARLGQARARSLQPYDQFYPWFTYQFHVKIVRGGGPKSLSRKYI